MERLLYSSPIAYSFGHISKMKTTASETGQSNRANFRSSLLAKSHKYMFCIVWMLSCNMDNEEADKPTTFEEAMTPHDWPEWKMAIEQESNSRMENGT